MEIRLDLRGLFEAANQTTSFMQAQITHNTEVQQLRGEVEILQRAAEGRGLGRRPTVAQTETTTTVISAGPEITTKTAVTYATCQVGADSKLRVRQKVDDEPST